ncbi:hypothetical protein ACHAXR_003642 [Thalassiosira sp. AJA248-18]
MHYLNTNCRHLRCTACKSVRYCNVDCQRAHRKVHVKECKRISNELENSRRAAAFEAAISELPLVEEVPSPPALPDCLICAHVMPPKMEQSSYLACCGNVVCMACHSRTIM